MTAEALLSRLTRVRKAGAGRWMACCPAHEDRFASLSVRELEDGRTLVHCFAGCGAAEVVEAAGLQLQDLFPVSLQGAHHRGDPRQVPAVMVLRDLAQEARIALVCAARVARGEVLSEQDQARLALAVGKLQQGANQAGGRSVR